MRHIWLTVLLAASMAAGPTVRAEMYKYRDAQGNICYTDNLAQIPEHQRPNAHSMEAISADEVSAEEKANLEEPDAGDQAESEAPDEMVVNDETIAALSERKKELDGEFSALMAEKYAILQEKQKLDGLAGRDVKARQAYEGKVTDLNNRIADYKTRHDAFKKECERVKQAVEPASPEKEDAETVIE